MSKKKICSWCHQSKNGDHSIALIRDQGKRTTISVFGGKLLVEIMRPQEKALHIFCDIAYCPFCGRKFKKEASNAKIGCVEGNYLPGMSCTN